MRVKTQPLAPAKSNLGDRLSDEVEKNRFIALPGKAHSSQNHVFPIWRDFVRSFIARFKI